jgi:hypothetical protein
LVQEKYQEEMALTSDKNNKNNNIIIIIIIIIIRAQWVRESYVVPSDRSCTGPHQHRCAVVQLEAQAIYFSAHKTARA